MVSGLCENQTLQNLALARLWALGSARLWAELRRLWARGCGAPNPFFLVARNCPSNASNPSNPSNAPTLANGCAIRLDSGRFRRSMDASDAPKPRTCSVVSGLCENQTLQNLALARLWALGSASLWAELRRLWVRGSGAPNTFGVAQAVGSGRWRAGAASLWILDASDAPKPRTCQTVGSGLCETVGGVAQAVGSGLWRAKSFFSSGPKLPFKRLKPLKPLKHLKRSDTCQWLCHTSGFWTLQTLHGCFRRSKTSHLPPRPAPLFFSVPKATRQAPSRHLQTLPGTFGLGPKRTFGLLLHRSLCVRRGSGEGASGTCSPCTAALELSLWNLPPRPAALFPESLAKGSSGKSFEHLHFDTYTYTHTGRAKASKCEVCQCQSMQV